MLNDSEKVVLKQRMENPLFRRAAQAGGWRGGGLAGWRLAAGGGQWPRAQAAAGGGVARRGQPAARGPVDRRQAWPCAGAPRCRLRAGGLPPAAPSHARGPWLVGFFVLSSFIPWGAA